MHDEYIKTSAFVKTWDNEMLQGPGTWISSTLLKLQVYTVCVITGFNLHTKSCIHDRTCVLWGIIGLSVVTGDLVPPGALLHW